MLEGGLRLSHAIHLIENFRPNEVAEANGLDLDTLRLVRFDARTSAATMWGPGRP
jgi:hypothetical protein